MVRVMQLVQHLRVGGLEKMAYSLCRKSHFSKQTILVSLEGETHVAKREWPQLGALSIHCLNKPAGVQWRIVKRIVDLIDNHQINVIHSHHIGPMFYASLAILLRPKVKHVTTLHDAWYLANKRARLMTKAICAFSPITVIADANAVAQQFKSMVTTEPSQVIHNGVDSDLFQPYPPLEARAQLGLPFDVQLIGCAARIERGKGHLDLLRALTYLDENMHLVFAGDGRHKARLERVCKKMGISHRVHWLGCIENMTLFYSAIDVFCLYSQKEGLPLTILEALFCNTPVVASDVGGVGEVLSKSNGILLSPSNRFQLPSALSRAMTLGLNQNVRKTVMGGFDLRKMAFEYDCVYQQIQH